MKVTEPGEFGLLELLSVRKRDLRPGWVGPGDDAAVIPSFDAPMVVSADLLAEDVHFRRATIDPTDLGYKTIAVNVSDIAAMGARPAACTITITLPPDTDVEWAKAFYAGLREAEEEFGCPLMGGDTSSGSSIVISIAIIGVAGRRGPVLRSTAMPEQDVWVTGRTGESAAGLAALEKGFTHNDPLLAPLIARHVRPTPRVGMGMELARRGQATAMIDVSDGIMRDARNLAAESGVGVRIEAARVGISNDLKAGAAALGLDPLALALGGGEDYELLFTAALSYRHALGETAGLMGVELTRIGTTTSGSGVVVVDADGRELDDVPQGFQHFST